MHLLDVLILSIPFIKTGTVTFLHRKTNEWLIYGVESRCPGRFSSLTRQETAGLGCERDFEIWSLVCGQLTCRGASEKSPAGGLALGISCSPQVHVRRRICRPILAGKKDGNFCLEASRAINGMAPRIDSLLSCGGWTPQAYSPSKNFDCAVST